MVIALVHDVNIMFMIFIPSVTLPGHLCLQCDRLSLL